MKAAVFLLAASILIANTMAGYAASDDGLNGVTVQFLRTACKDESSTTPTGTFCLGFVEGVGELMAVNGIEYPKMGDVPPLARRYFSNVSLCPGPTIGIPSGGALIQAFLNWSDKHPEEWSEDALVGIQRALQSTWPCS